MSLGIADPNTAQFGEQVMCPRSSAFNFRNFTLRQMSLFREYGTDGSVVSAVFERAFDRSVISIVPGARRRARNSERERIFLN